MRRDVGRYLSGEISVYEGQVSVREGRAGGRFGGRTLAHVERTSAGARLSVAPATGEGWDDAELVDEPFITVAQASSSVSNFYLRFVKLGPHASIFLASTCTGCVTSFLDARPRTIRIAADLTPNTPGEEHAHVEGVLDLVSPDRVTAEQIVILARAPEVRAGPSDITWPIGGDPRFELTAEEAQRLPPDCTMMYTALAWIARECPRAYGVRDVYVAAEHCDERDAQDLLEERASSRGDNEEPL